MEILCTLPIKTLTTCKSVCKSWLNLIRDPHFCHLHRDRAPTELCVQPYHDVNGNTLELHLGNFDFPNNLDPCHLEIPKFSVRLKNVPNYKAMKGKFIFANSCNGLLCYYGDPDCRFVVVWNPCTSEFITFPSPPFPGFCRGYGLGFSRKANKFKLLLLMLESDYDAPDVFGAYICTIEKSCSWKRIGPCSSHAWFRQYSNKVKDLHGVFLQGTLHWVGTDSHRSTIDIRTFDFEDDHFGTLPLPPCFDKRHWDDVRDDRIGVLAGCLVVTEYTELGVAIWLMRKYGVQDSWTKLFCLGYTLDKGLKYHHCRPITFMDNGEILMTSTYSSSTVFVYNPVLKSVKVIGSGPVSLRVIAYSPSLVLLKDSMFGYDVHVKPRFAGLKQGEMSTTPNWWTPMKDRWRPVKESPQQHGSKLSDAEVEEEREGHVSATSESSDSATSESSASESSADAEWEGQGNISRPISLKADKNKGKAQAGTSSEGRFSDVEAATRLLELEKVKLENSKVKAMDTLLNRIGVLEDKDMGGMTEEERDQHKRKLALLWAKW